MCLSTLWMKDVLVASLEMVLIVTSLEEARDTAESSRTPPQDTPTAKNYPTQNVSSAEVEKRG